MVGVMTLQIGWIKGSKTARQFYQPNPDAVNWNTAVNFASTYGFGAADLFRVVSEK